MEWLDENILKAAKTKFQRLFAYDCYTRQKIELSPAHINMQAELLYNIFVCILQKILHNNFTVQLVSRRHILPYIVLNPSEFSHLNIAPRMYPI
jgi:hypothetical protein